MDELQRDAVDDETYLLDLNSFHFLIAAAGPDSQGVQEFSPAIRIAQIALCFSSRVPLYVQEAKRNIRIFPLSWRSAMKFARESLSE
jgi:hypothetical protein